MEVCDFFNHIPFVSDSAKVASNPDKIGQCADERRGSIHKTSSSSVQGKKRQYRAFAHNADDDDDAMNDSNNEDTLHKNTATEDKSRLKYRWTRTDRLRKELKRPQRRRPGRRGGLTRKAVNKSP